MAKTSNLRRLRTVPGAKPKGSGGSGVTTGAVARQKTTSTYKVATVTSDGVEILAPKIKPKHFTAAQIRKTIADVEADDAN